MAPRDAQEHPRSIQKRPRYSQTLPKPPPNPPKTVPKPSQDPPQSDQKSIFSSNSFLERLSTPYVHSRGCPKPPKTSPKTSQHGVKIDKKIDVEKQHAFLYYFGWVWSYFGPRFRCFFLYFSRPKLKTRNRKNTAPVEAKHWFFRIRSVQHRKKTM